MAAAWRNRLEIVTDALSSLRCARCRRMRRRLLRPGNAGRVSPSQSATF